jgi:bacillopeptidase F (M6 metalloprotease family)
MALDISPEEKQHYAEVMYNKSYDRLTEEEKIDLQNYYEQEAQYLEIMEKYGESGVSKAVKNIFI